MDEIIKERYELSSERIRAVTDEELLPEPFGAYFRWCAAFLCEGTYEDLLPEKYGQSYTNPGYAAKIFGTDLGRLLSFLAYELTNILPFRAEGDIEEITKINEVFLETYGAFLQMNEDGEDPAQKCGLIKDILYHYVFDYLDETMEKRIASQLDPSKDFALRIINDSDLSDLSYLDAFGEYINEDTRQTAAFLNSLPEEEIKMMADTFTEGFRKGFVTTGQDITKKKTVSIRYNLGFERLVRAEIESFEKLGLDVTICRRALNPAAKNGLRKIGYYGESVNEQMDFDHREDNALFLDRAFVERKLEALKNAYEKNREKAALYAGPACMERFGEKEFTPKIKNDSFLLSKEQRALQTELASRSADIADGYIHSDEISYTIISYPIPAIGKDFGEIFRETVRINTLPYEKYLKIQQEIIKTLEKGRYVEVKGKDGNETDIRVSLTKMEDPAKQTVFENCVADVNIPVGEVFTSPRLSGTTGVLHVSQVYLFGLMYRDLKFVIEDGFVKDYSCSNFETEEENRRYIEENILHGHETLPVGEFAIGT
ncbi:MAG: aminopeptidase, partial [Lachnospiraceae bacterium]|nr:aminopeptidase [Lachnospiraceae bacterium]